MLEIAIAPDCIEQLQESLFPLAADSVVHVICVERDRCIVGGEIASPNDRQVWEAGTNFAAACDCADSLWARHNRDS